MQDAEPEAALDGDDEEIVEFAPLPEPVLGERHQIDVAVNGDRDAEPATQQFAEADVALGKDWALPTDAGGVGDHARQADAEAGDVLHLQFRVADAAPDPILDEIGDDSRRLAADADRQRQFADEIGAEIGDRDGDEIGRELDADDARRLRVEAQHHARPAAAGVAQRAELQSGDEAVVEQSGGDRRDGRRAEVGALGDLDPAERSEAADRVHHMETVDSAHQFGVGGFHVSLARGANALLCG